jgi:hypothetical protein
MTILAPQSIHIHCRTLHDGTHAFQDFRHLGASFARQQHHVRGGNGSDVIACLQQPRREDVPCSNKVQVA